MGTSTGQQYPLSIQAKLPLISTARSKGQFKPPKRALPQEETDSSMADDELRSIYKVRIKVSNVSSYLCSSPPQECDSAMCTNGGTGSNQISSNSWLSKRRKLDTSEADFTSSLETKVVSR